MTITTKTNANGRISGYYVDGEKVRKDEIDGIINARRDEIIYVDYYDGLEFGTLTGSFIRQLKVVFTNCYDRTVMTQAAADQLGYRIIKKFTGDYFNAYLVEKTEVTDDERNEILSTPLVTLEAMQEAINAEIKLATANNTADLDIEYANGKEAYEKVSQIYGLKTTSASGGRIMWFYYGNRISGKRAAEILAEYGFTIEEYLVACQIANNYFRKVIAPQYKAIYEQAEFLAEKIWGESKPLDDDDDVFNALPAVDELNDVEGFDEELVLPKCELNKEIWFGRTGIEYCFIRSNEELVVYTNGELFKIISFRLQAGWKTDKFFLIGNYLEEKTVSDDEFFEAMKKRGVYMVDEFAEKLAKLQAEKDAAFEALAAAEDKFTRANRELEEFMNDTASKLSAKLQTLKPQGKITIISQSGGRSFKPADFDDVYIDAEFDKFAFNDWRGRSYAGYDTPAQIEAVIKELAAAIERGDKEFQFPDVDSLAKRKVA